MHYCYNYLYQGQIIEAPTLRLNPGDQLILNLIDNIQAPYYRYTDARKPGNGSHAWRRSSPGRP